MLAGTARQQDLEPSMGSRRPRNLSHQLKSGKGGHRTALFCEQRHIRKRNTVTL